MHLVARCVLVVKCMACGFRRVWAKILASSFISHIVLYKLFSHLNFNFFNYKMGEIVVLKGLNEYKYMYILNVYQAYQAY